MKIAYMLPLNSIFFGRADGVFIQAETFADSLNASGHQATIVKFGETYDWKSFDIIHVFCMWTGLPYFMENFLKRSQAAIVYSPLIDAHRQPIFSRLASWCDFPPLHMVSPWSDIRKSVPCVTRWQARSKHEMRYIQKALQVPEEKIDIVPLILRNLDSSNHAPMRRENFCLHVSILSAAGKNVKRLVEAAIRFKFNLVLAGNPGDEDFAQWLRSTQNKHPNIRVLGRISDAQLKELYSKAKVFALPSVFEGVGLVALEAAAHGCEIVLTNRDAPKEYYDGMAHLVDPTSIDEIGETILDTLQGKAPYQPKLSEYIKQTYSAKCISNKLLKSYKLAISEKNASA